MAGRAFLKPILVLWAVLPTYALADDARARVNYMIHCQGCHLPGAVGHPGKVPRLSNFVGYFLHSTEGREFIVRVPGVATSSLPDDQLSELVNWILVTYSKEQLPPDYVAYTEAEIARLRPQLELDPESKRLEILGRIASGVPTLAKELQQVADY